MTPADSGARCKHRPRAAPRDAATPRPSPHNPSPRALRVRRGRRRTLPVSSDAPSKRYRLGMPSFGLLLVLVITLELLRFYDWCAPAGRWAPNERQTGEVFLPPSEPAMRAEEFSNTPSVPRCSWNGRSRYAAEPVRCGDLDPGRGSSQLLRRIPNYKSG